MPCFGHGLTLVFFASMTGLSVRPALAYKDRAGCVTGVAASIVARLFSPKHLDAAFPLHMAACHAGAKNPFPRHRVCPYIFLWMAEAIRRRWIFGRPPMLNDVYNARILDLSGNI